MKTLAAGIQRRGNQVPRGGRRGEPESWAMRSPSICPALAQNPARQAMDGCKMSLTPIKLPVELTLLSVPRGAQNLLKGCPLCLPSSLDSVPGKVFPPLSTRPVLEFVFSQNLFYNN